ncbi:MAG: hypothetical protein V1739_06170, partial [Candidatus Omnitrophota bacterium]
MKVIDSINDNFKKLQIKKNDRMAIVTIIAAIFIYTLPLLLRLDKALTLTNKNCLAAWYRTYFLGLYPYASVVFEHKFPFWSAFREGGFYWLMYPTELSCNIFSLFMLPFGVVKGLNFSWYILYYLGALSMFYLTRFVLKFNIFGSIYASLVFSMCGFFPFMQGLGLWTRETLLLPLLVGLFLKAKENKIFIFLAGLVLSLFVHTVLFFPVVILFLFLVSILNPTENNNFVFRLKKENLIVFFSCLSLALLFSAYKLLPVIELLTSDMRVSGLVYKSAIHQPNTLSLFLRHMLVPENLNVGTMYIGFAPLFLAILSMVVFFKNSKKWIFILLIFIILSFGPNAFIDLHYFLWHLPIFKSMREISKYYSLIIVFIISLLSGKFFSLFDYRKPLKVTTILSIFLLIFTFCDLLWANAGYFNIYNTKTSFSKPDNYSGNVKAINIHKGDEGITDPLRLALYLKGFGLVNAQYHKFVQFFKESYISPKYFIMPEYAFITPSTKLFVLYNPVYQGEAYFLDQKNKVESFS